jgi:CBS-domain-containing membrane protein
LQNIAVFDTSKYCHQGEIIQGDSCMTDKYSALPLINLNEHTGFQSYELAGHTSENSPAIKVMTDFKHTAPVTIDEDVRIDDALDKMRVYGVRLLLVIDNDKEVMGIISAKDIQGEKPIKISQEARISRADIRVNMIMSPRSEIKVLSMAHVANAQVGDIISSLKQYSHQHLLVVDSDATNSKQKIRGLFSTTQISKQLGKDLLGV